MLKSIKNSKIKRQQFIIKLIEEIRELTIKEKLEFSKKTIITCKNVMNIYKKKFTLSLNILK